MSIKLFVVWRMLKIFTVFSFQNSAKFFRVLLEDELKCREYEALKNSYASLDEFVASDEYEYALERCIETDDELSTFLTHATL